MVYNYTNKPLYIKQRKMQITLKIIKYALSMKQSQVINSYSVTSLYIVTRSCTISVVKRLGLKKNSYANKWKLIYNYYPTELFGLYNMTYCKLCSKG